MIYSIDMRELCAMSSEELKMNITFYKVYDPFVVPYFEEALASPSV